MTPRDKALQAIREIEELAELDRQRAVLIRQINDVLRRVRHAAEAKRH